MYISAKPLTIKSSACSSPTRFMEKNLDDFKLDGEPTGLAPSAPCSGPPAIGLSPPASPLGFSGLGIPGSGGRLPSKPPPPSSPSSSGCQFLSPCRGVFPQGTGCLPCFARHWLIEIAPLTNFCWSIVHSNFSLSRSSSSNHSFRSSSMRISLITSSVKYSEREDIRVSRPLLLVISACVCEVLRLTSEIIPTSCGETWNTAQILRVKCS